MSMNSASRRNIDDLVVIDSRPLLGVRFSSLWSGLRMAACYVTTWRYVRFFPVGNKLIPPNAWMILHSVGIKFWIDVGLMYDARSLTYWIKARFITSLHEEL